MSIEEAARRRDFTVNAISWDPLTGEYVDPFNGRADLERKILRAVDPATFGDDSLRVLRAVQFAARFELTLDEADEGAVPIDPPRRSAAGAHLGRDRKAAAARAAAVDRIRAGARARRHRSAVSRAEGARRVRAGTGMASRRRRLGAHAAGDRPGAAAHRRSRSRRSAHRDARRGDATISASRRRRRSSTAASDR